MIDTIKIWWKKHKTKTTGITMIILASVHQYSDQLQHLLTPTVYSAVFMGAGVIVSVLGFLNTQEAKENQDPSQP